MLSYLLSVLAGFSFAILSAAPRSQFPPPLEKEEEDRLFHQWRETGDMAAREKLIEHNLRLVAHIVRKYYAASPDKDDLVSIGSIGLIKSIDSFDPSNGARFATYSAKCIQNEILMYFRSQKKYSQEVSIHDTIDTDRDGNPLTYADIMGSDDTIADDIDTKIKLSKAAAFITAGLEDREREIVVLRYGLAGNPPMPQREVAGKLGISRSYVSRRRYCKR
ncbi:MAG: sigma-70 family RNA polymerase sigma factor [Ruminococcaceae bacterium]|nr:sigma-70 family RNA polymerase sigma factor [Oscillospiraceae bacterium]